ncbi:MAG: mercuric transporter MerT family protein [Planctomycetota bacterium]|nr:mercuric transporter MerT family protein [Planctomycetota bacterium]
MTAEMKIEEENARRVECPSCSTKAKRVSPVTLGALLKDEFAKPFATKGHSGCDTPGDGCQPVTGDTGWWFCDSRDCGVVYFSEVGETTFTKSQLNVSVGVKETSGERPLCYCFGHSVASIKDELRTKGRSDALDNIRAKMKDPGCHCETTNPSGSCCLGVVTRGIQIAQEEFSMDGSNVMPATPARSSTGWAETITKLGTVVSAIMASACCWLPLLLLAVGVSGAGIAATLEAYRPLFIVVTLGFLGAAFYLTYRPKRNTAGCCASETTVGEDCCTPSGKQRFSMMATNKFMLWVVTGLAVAFLFFPNYVGILFGTGNGADATENVNQDVFQVEGMTCDGCATTVAHAIRQVPGVLSVDVSYETQQAIVSTESCCSVPTEKILTALKNAGYSGVLSHQPFKR